MTSPKLCPDELPVQAACMPNLAAFSGAIGLYVRAAGMVPFRNYLKVLACIIRLTHWMEDLPGLAAY